QGAILGEQCIEKLFKGGQRLSGNSTQFKRMGHRPSGFSDFDWFDSTPYQELIRAFENLYEKCRYPATEDGETSECLPGVDRKQFELLDELVIAYLDAVPIEVPQRIALGFYAEFYNKLQFEKAGYSALRWEVLARDNLPLGKSLEMIERVVRE